MTSTISYNLTQLDDFRRTATSQAGAVGSIADTVPNAAAASMFGANSAAGAMSSAVGAFGAAVRGEFSRAEDLLRDVATAIDSVQAAVEDADRRGSRAFRAGTTATQSYGGGSGAGGAVPVASADPNAGTAPAVKFGSGVSIKLPDGNTVYAPNQQAAGAVREALTQLGVPYVWGAAAPGQGFDCSGLTSWAYGKEGIRLAHLAADQDIGQRVSMANLAPGDLAVWDGHVAMYIGDGKVIEAPCTGETVHIVPVYTVNGSDRFEGFYRPSS